MVGKKDLDEKSFTMMNTYNERSVQPAALKVQPKEPSVQPRKSLSGGSPEEPARNLQLSEDNQKATDATKATEHATEKANLRLRLKGQSHKELSFCATNATEYFLKVYNGKEIAKKMRIRANIHTYKILRKRRLHGCSQLHG